MKKGLVILISFSLIFLLGMSVVSASWFGDIWKKITGRTTENETGSTCTDDCSSDGTKQCSGSGYQTCGNYDSDSCLEWSSATSCLSSETCVQGACVSNTFICTDTDGGKEYNTRGNVVASSPTSSIDVTDLCSDSTRVVEYFCTADKQQSGETYTCPNGCSNGACVSSTTTTNTSNTTSATTSTTTVPTTTTTSTLTSTTTTTSAGASSGGKSISTITEISKGVFEEKTITEEKSEGETKITTETKELTNILGNKIKINVKTEIKEDGTTFTEEKREFINKDGRLIKLRFRFENDGENVKIRREVEVEGKKFESELEILEKFEGEEVQLKVKLSDGNEQEIKIMPDRASEIAIEKLKSKNFEIELKEVGEGENLKAVYIAKVDENGRLLGLFRVRLKSEAQINSETGEIISLEKSWWNFLVTSK